ncbi:glycoside hydrolase [Schizothecium vesticola]|uniref:lytic cellulose monooxygenase (C4-dehydrogenating) n=1 Tax=Schizothecium vesticola TaxID=314040 RepID=A0AA40F722_9PEZI|nr:glycoside hydrolase [Schizothecium vesticola]
MLVSLTLVVATALSASAHYTFPRVAGGGDWQHVRRADNFQSNGFVGNVNSEQMRCFQSNHQGAQATLTVAAGSSVPYHASQGVYHPGPMAFYMARVPDGQSVSSWKGDGAVWFKIYHEQPGFGQQLTWGSSNKATFSAPIPSCIKAGNYLLRAEHLGLHSAGSPGGAQFYISCAQLEVTGGGSTEPPNKVSFPGAYQANHPGIQININWPIPTSYKNPGPDVFKC